MTTIEIAVEALSEEAFAPYGWLLDAGSVPDFVQPTSKNWRIPFHSDAPLRLQVMRYDRQAMQLSLFERHLCVTEARHPIGDAAAILVVAGVPESDATPELNSVRAFFLDGTKGIMFKKGVWHGLDCFPARAEHVDYLFLSDALTEDEIETSADPVAGERTELYDFAAQKTSFQITDPLGLTS